MLNICEECFKKLYYLWHPAQGSTVRWSNESPKTRLWLELKKLPAKQAAPQRG
jgi:hypothetical protein